MTTKPPLTVYLIQRVIKVVDQDYDLDVRPAEVKAVYENDDRVEIKVGALLPIRQALSEYRLL